METILLSISKSLTISDLLEREGGQEIDAELPQREDYSDPLPLTGRVPLSRIIHRPTGKLDGVNLPVLLLLSEQSANSS